VTDTDTLSIVEVAFTPVVDSRLEADCEAEELPAVAVEGASEGDWEEEEFVLSSVELALAVAVG